MADSSCQFNSIIFSIPSKPPCRQAMSPARAVAQPQIENNIRLDAVFKKPLYIARKLVGHGDKGVVCRNRASLLSSTLLTTGSTSLLKSYSLESRSHFSPSSGEIARAYLHASNSKALFLKQRRVFYQKVFIILIALFLRFSQIILPALTYAFRRRTRSRWRSRAFARQSSLPVNSSKLWSGYIFLQYSCAEDQHFRATPRPRYSGRT